MPDQLPCSYCGLPAAVPSSDVGDDSSIFCCLGCRIAASIMRSDDEPGANQSALTRLGLAVFFTMNVMVFTVALWTWNVHELPDDSRIHAFREVLRYACLLFSAPVLILLGGPLVESSVETCRRRRFTTDVLLLAGVCAAFLYSVYSLLAGLADVYFEVACMILVAVTFGKWLEATAKFKVTRALRSLRQLLPSEVRVVQAGTETMVEIGEVRPGALIRVLAGERIPVDGVFEEGICTVDEQILTGESIPRSKQLGDAVHGGALNLVGDVYLRATTSASSGAIARLAKAVEEATASECKAIRRADQLAMWFVPVITGACACAFVLNIPEGLQHALMASLSVVLIACPCALGIATPLALWVAVNLASRHGVLFRSGDAVIHLAKVRAMAFDKTGTVTNDNMHVGREVSVSLDCPSFGHRLAASLAASSTHVLSKAVASELERDFVQPFQYPRLRNVENRPGEGVTGMLDDSVVMLGSIELGRKLGFAVSRQLEAEICRHPELGVVCVGWNRKVQTVFLLGEDLRAEAEQVFARLRKLGIELVILTGDHRQRAAATQRKTGVATIGPLLPAEKKDELFQLPHPVAMVGDGINDALALAVADVGIALDCGADISREAADVCLLGSTLAQLPSSVELARATQKTINRNLVWAMGYNAVGMGFAVAGLLNPIIAAIAMVGSSLFVLTNSLSLSHFEFSPEANHQVPDRPDQESEEFVEVDQHRRTNSELLAAE